VGTCAFCEADIREGGGTQIVGTDYRICDKCLAIIDVEVDAEIEAIFARRLQAARDNAAPADSPTGPRVDR